LNPNDAIELIKPVYLLASFELNEGQKHWLKL